jgi:hypothetical protein
MWRLILHMTAAPYNVTMACSLNGADMIPGPGFTGPGVAMPATRPTTKIRHVNI